MEAVMFVADEAQSTCETFIAEGGMEIFIRVLEASDHISVSLYIVHRECDRCACSGTLL